MPENRTLLDSFKKFEIIRKPGHEIVSGDFFYTKYPNLGKDFGLLNIQEEWLEVTSAFINSYSDGSIYMTLFFEGVQSSLEVNGHNFYTIKTFSLQNN